MSYNGSGTFQINTSGQPVVAGTVISSTAFNALTADLATGLSTAITKDGQTTTTARIIFAQGTRDNTLTASSAVATDASKNLVSVTNTGTGNNVLATSPTLVTPALGTPASGVMTNVTGINYDGFKNRIINGAMAINQRAFSGTAVDIAYTLDRWQTYSGAAAKFTVSQSSTAPTGFKNSLLATSSSAYTPLGATEVFTINQNIEGYNFSDFEFGTANAQPVTLSFRVYSSLTGTFGGSLVNSAFSRTCPFSYSIPTANTWTTITVTIAGDTTGTWVTDNGIGLRVLFALGAGSSRVGTAGVWSSNIYLSATGATNLVSTNGATFYITGVQLEKGSTATSFDYRPYGTELQLCQRYYEKANYDVRVYSAAIGGSFVAPFTVVEKRTLSYTPAFTGSAVQNNISGTPAITPINTRQIRFAYTAAAVGDTYYVREFEMPAEL